MRVQCCILTAFLPLFFSLYLPAQGPSNELALHAFDGSFWKLVDHKAKLTTMGAGFGFTEGPVWEEGGSLVVSDEERNEIDRIFPDGHHEKVASLGDPDGITFDRQHRLVIAASVLRAVVRLTTAGSAVGSHVEILADRFEGKRLNSPNDITLGPDGALYFTDPTLDLVKGERQELAFQGVFRLAPDGTLTLLSRELTQPNGIAFSPDGKYLYVDDSAQRNIRRYSFHSDGTVTSGIVFADEHDKVDSAVPDGMKCDRTGNLFVTGPQGIWVWSPQGKHLGTIVLPHQPANLTWGGAHNSTLFLTAGPEVYVLPLKTRGHLSYPAKVASR